MRIMKNISSGSEGNDAHQLPPLITLIRRGASLAKQSSSEEVISIIANNSISCGKLCVHQEKSFERMSNAKPILTGWKLGETTKTEVH